jgi:NAD(P)-dependent dehydrogenase (short-subunit alcohol dehydrogenase family)
MTPYWLMLALMAMSASGSSNLPVNIVITGATRGIGYGLATAFLERGCTIAISGRTQEVVDQARQRLLADYPEARIIGLACDVRDPSQVQRLWDLAVETWGRVDIWLNNAGLSGPQAMIWEYSSEQATEVLSTNILGTVYGCQIAVVGMLKQGSGAVYNMEGMGSDGRMHPGLSSYGTSKYAISYFTRALANELKDSAIIIGSLRPGMVVTDLLTEQFKDRPEEFQRVKRIFNIIAERVEVVTPWLAERILSNTRSGVVIRYLSRWGLFWRFALAPIRKRELFDDWQP